MRVLTVRQPWAWAIVRGGKDVENRVRNIAGAYRGPVAIQAGLARVEDDGSFWEVKRAIRSEELGWVASDGEVWAADTLEPGDARFVYGAIIGVVDLVDVHWTSNTPKPFCVQIGVPNGLADAVAADSRCESAWAEPRAGWHLVLANPRPLSEPIPFRGALGLRELDRAIEDEVWARR